MGAKLIAFLISFALWTPQLFAEGPPAKKLNLNPVPKPIPATTKPDATANEQKPKEVRQLPRTKRVCEQGEHRYLISDEIDEARCTEAGGKIRDTYHSAYSKEMKSIPGRVQILPDTKPPLDNPHTPSVPGN